MKIKCQQFSGLVFAVHMIGDKFTLRPHTRSQLFGCADAGRLLSVVARRITVPSLLKKFHRTCVDVCFFTGLDLPCNTERSQSAQRGEGAEARPMIQACGDAGIACRQFMTRRARVAWPSVAN